MNPRERILTTLAHKESDRVPVDLGGTPTGIEAGTYSTRFTTFSRKSRLRTSEGCWRQPSSTGLTRSVPNGLLPESHFAL
jgi:hypothetical protein